MFNPGSPELTVSKELLPQGNFPSRSIDGKNQGMKQVQPLPRQIRLSIFPNYFGKKIEACSETWDECKRALLPSVIYFVLVIQ
jgi:hypothetical protein